MAVSRKIWMLYDGRYRTDEDRSMCYEVCDSKIEAEENASDYGNDTVIVEAELFGKEIRNSKIIN